VKGEAMKLELILLGLLKNKSMHGYEIKKVIKDEIRPLTNVTLTSIYYTLDKLAQKGYLRCEKEREGNRPERHVYYITPKGERYFKKLLIRSLIMLERPFFNLDLGLYFLKELPPTSLKRMERLLNKRIANLKEAIEWAEELKEDLAHKKEPFNRILIPEHLKKMLESEVAFTEELKRLFTTS
jgi:DNA-binding PadR family transcriptional regulator